MSANDPFHFEYVVITEWTAAVSGRHAQVQDQRHQTPESPEQRQPGVHQPGHPAAERAARPQELRRAHSGQGRQRDDAPAARESGQDLRVDGGAAHQKGLRARSRGEPHPHRGQKHGRQHELGHDADHRYNKTVGLTGPVKFSFNYYFSSFYYYLKNFFFVVFFLS